MNSVILARALQVVPEKELLVNIVRLRVRQLAAGHRPLVAVPPGTGLSDVALREVAEKKLTSEAKVIVDFTADAAPAEAIIDFPAPPTRTKKKAA